MKHSLLLVLATSCVHAIDPRCERSGLARDVGWSGHRGATLLFPDDVELSRAALEHLLASPPESGPHRVEFDIGTTRDGRLVVIHDKTTCRVSMKDVSVADTDFASLPPLKDGSMIQTLQDYVQPILEFDGELQVEFDIKYPSKGTYRELASVITEVSARQPTLLRVKEYVPKTKALIPQICADFSGTHEIFGYRDKEGRSCRYGFDGECVRLCDER